MEDTISLFFLKSYSFKELLKTDVVLSGDKRPTDIRSKILLQQMLRFREISAHDILYALMIKNDDNFYDYFIFSDIFYFNGTLPPFYDKFFFKMIDKNDSFNNNIIPYDLRNANENDYIIDNNTINNQFTSFFIFNDVITDKRKIKIFIWMLKLSFIRYSMML